MCEYQRLNLFFLITFLVSKGLHKAWTKDLLRFFLFRKKEDFKVVKIDSVLSLLSSGVDGESMSMTFQWCQ
jgi:hypothetical protein